MDIAKFLEEQKFCKIALSGLLTPSQLMFCEKEAKQVVHHGNVRSTYSSDEEHFNSDDSVLGGFGKHGVGVVVKANDNYAYVDAMTKRLNETDIRLLRASINDRPQKNTAGDNEGGSLPDRFIHEEDFTNQPFEYKPKVDLHAQKSAANRKNQVAVVNQVTNHQINVKKNIQGIEKMNTLANSVDYDTQNMLKMSVRQSSYEVDTH